MKLVFVILALLLFLATFITQRQSPWLGCLPGEQYRDGHCVRVVD